MARWGPQVRPNPETSIRTGPEEGAPVSKVSSLRVVAKDGVAELPDLSDEVRIA